MPYELRFWNAENLTSDTKKLGEQKGFITAFPVAWTTGENVRIPYPTPLVVDINGQHDSHEDSQLHPVALALNPEAQLFTPTERA